MIEAAAVLDALRAGRPVACRLMIVVAHPDDETIGLGAQLCRRADALLLHVTDGAPRDGDDARRCGFATVGDYAAARQAELAAALQAGGASGIRSRGLGIPDKEAMRDLAGLARRLAKIMRAETPAAVLTHAYEGGHPDHDAAAFAVHAASRLVAGAPAIIEFPLYHRGPGRLVSGRFLDSPPSAGREWVRHLDDRERDRKRQMIDCFTTQRWLLAQFDLTTERFRPAPDYDFTRPPHPGALHYETLGWDIDGADWRREAAAALDRLGLPG